MTLHRFFSLFFILLLAFLLDILTGSSALKISEVWNALWAGPSGPAGTAHEVLWLLRIPKALAAALAGAGLAVAGMQLQTLFRNPLAGPYELGVSAGAGLGVALFTMAGWTALFGQTGSLGAAACGAFAVMGLLAFLAPLLRGAATLLLAGLLITSALGAVIGALQYQSEAGALQAFVDWTLSSVGGVTWNQLEFFIPVCFLGLAASWIGAKSLNAMLLGEEEARSLGARVTAGRFLNAASSSLLAAAVAAFCGPIAFVGLGIPHVARWWVKKSDHRILIPTAALLGAATVLACDTLASAFHWPLNVVTSGLGAPLVLVYLLRRRVEFS